LSSGLTSYFINGIITVSRKNAVSGQTTNNTTAISAILIAVTETNAIATKMNLNRLNINEIII
jgi:hypothetical protein